VSGIGIKKLPDKAVADIRLAAPLRAVFPDEWERILACAYYCQRRRHPRSSGEVAAAKQHECPVYGRVCLRRGGGTVRHDALTPQLLHGERR
jgi:hypothetical protein